jgi:hypothetical protein
MKWVSASVRAHLGGTSKNEGKICRSEYLTSIIEGNLTPLEENSSNLVLNPALPARADKIVLCGYIRILSLTRFFVCVAPNTNQRSKPNVISNSVLISQNPHVSNGVLL